MEIEMYEPSNKDDGGPAFPVGVRVVHQDSRGGHVVHEADPGMSMRDYFAAKAMQGMLTNPDIDYSASEYVAMVSYTIADAMLKEREK